MSGSFPKELRREEGLLDRTQLISRASLSPGGERQVLLYLHQSLAVLRPLPQGCLSYGTVQGGSLLSPVAR